MDNFNLQGYIASGKLHANSKTLTEAKKQGYDDREDESLGARKGAEKGKKQSMKARRDDSYGKFGKRDAEKKGKNKINKESQDIEEGLLDFLKKKKEAAPVKREDPNPIIGVDYDGNYIRKDGTMAEGVVKENKLAQKLRDEAKHPDSKVGAAIFNKYAEKIENSDKEDYKKIIKSMESELISKHPNTFSGEDDIPGSFLSEDARTDAEQEGYKDGFDDAKDDVKDALSKMKVSELKAKIKEQILSTLTEADEEVDVDIDVEDEVEVEAGADDIEIERPGVKATVNVGLSPEEEIVQDSLKAAMDAAQALGSDKLADQIGNTITFFTRQFVVGDSTD